MTYPNGYTPREHAHALGDLARDICLHMELCKCGEEMQYEPPHPAEPDTGAAKWRGGFVCGGCGAERENPEYTEDDALDAAEDRAYREERAEEDDEPFDEFTGGWWPMRRADA